MMRMTLAVLTAVSMAASARAADPVNIPFNVIEAAFKTAECSNELKEEPRTEVEDLNGRLKLVEIYCWRAAYQSGSIFFAVDPAAPEKARLLRFQEWSKKGLVWTYSLTEGDFDPKTKKLNSFHKGRGVGDCGAMGVWKWLNGSFKLASYWVKENCDGTPFDNDKKWRVYPPK